MAIRAGALRKRVRFEGPTVGAENPLGESTSTFAAIATRYAQVEPLSGREFFAAKQTSTEVSVRVRCRWFPGVDASERIVVLPATADPADPSVDRILDIDSILNIDERNRELEIFCTEHSA